MSGVCFCLKKCTLVHSITYVNNTLRPRQNGEHFADDISKLYCFKKIVVSLFEFHWDLLPLVQLSTCQLCSDNGLALIKPISGWTNDGPVNRCKYPSFRLDESTNWLVWLRRTQATLFLAIACCLTTPCDYLEQCSHYSDVITRVMAFPISSVSILFWNHLFRSEKTSKLRVTGLCEGTSPVTGEISAQRDSNAETVSIRWRHHAVLSNEVLCQWYQENIIRIDQDMNKYTVLRN